MGYIKHPTGDEFHLGPDLYDHRPLSSVDQAKYNVESLCAYIRQQNNGSKNKIIKGLQTAISQDATYTSKVTVTIQPGIAIIDGVLFILEEPQSLDISLTYGQYPVDHGLLIANIAVNKNLDQISEPPFIHLTFVDPSQNPKPLFYHNIRNFIIGVFAISRDSNNQISLINNVTETYTSGGILIEGRNYRSYMWRPENALVIPDPVSYFPFEGEVKDMISGQVPTSLGSGFSFTQGKYGDYAISFNGSSGQGSIYSPFHYQFTTVIQQICGWFKIPSGVTSGTFMTLVSQSNNNRFYKLQVNGSQFGIRMNDGMMAMNRMATFQSDVWFFWSHMIIGYGINMVISNWNNINNPALRNVPLDLSIGDDITNEGPDPAIGEMDQVRIYDGRVTDTIAEMLYQEAD